MERTHNDDGDGWKESDRTGAPAFRKRRGFRLPLHSCLAVLLLMGTVTEADAADTFTRIGEIRGLSREEANKALPVRLRGVVTWSYGTNWFSLQDESGGVAVNIEVSRKARVWTGGDAAPEQIEVGREVEIEGVTHAGGFSPDILPSKLHLLNKKPLPEARPIKSLSFFAGVESSERVEVRGVILGYKHLDSGVILLQADVGQGRCIIVTTSAVLNNPAELVDAEVCLKGVAGTLFNARGEMTGVCLRVSQPGDVVVEKPAACSPFAAPRLALSQLRPFRQDFQLSHRQCVEGTVSYVQSEQVFYIQEGELSVRVETLTPETWFPGDCLQVSGFVDMRRQVAGLSGALARRVGRGTLPKPVLIAPGKILALNTKAAQSGQVSEPNDFDGRLITFRARLLMSQPSFDQKPPWQRLTLDADGTIVEALLYTVGDRTVNERLPGSEVLVTGLVQLEYDALAQYVQAPPSGLSVLLRSMEDVSVLRPPSWWTPARSVGIVAIGSVVLFGVLLWSGQMRRQLARKTKLLAVEMRARRDVAIEMKAALRERGRLAANLHDTLLQTMSGLVYQLEACETEAVPQAERKADYLATARRMVQRAQDDLRGTVWALRVLPSHTGSFADSLRVLARQLAEGREVEITTVEHNAVPKLPEFVAANLLLVAQEAVHNALKHARPSRINMTLSASPDGKQITLKVRDNGIGFDPAASPCQKAGHFGLEGMRERAEQLGGKMRIESQPGHGTCVWVKVMVRPFDRELEDL